MTRKLTLFTIVLCLGIILGAVSSQKETKDDANEKWKKKDVRDYNDVDMERLFEQWENADEDELEEDELPEWKRDPPKVDMTQIDPSDPEGFLKMSKKGRTLMMFATVSGDPKEEETGEISKLWHSSLFNAHIDTQRFVVGSNRVLFMLTDGGKAWEVKDFLVSQDRCAEVTIEGQNFPGAGADKKTGPNNNQKKNEEL